jgi:hypothetical protein
LLKEVGGEKQEEVKLKRYVSTKIIKKLKTNLTEKGELMNQKSSRSKNLNNSNNGNMTSLFSESDYKSSNINDDE